MSNNLWELIMFNTHLKIRYQRICENPEKREKSVYFGVLSILFSIIGAVIVALCAFGISSLMDNDNLLSIVFIVILALCILISIVECTIRSLISTVYQLKVNKLPIGWAALAVFIVTFIAMVVVSILMLAKVV
ncbi:MAG: hypothetical protein NC037_06180 [Bacteroides sp.]|nr:hypothetical protein [Bacillota bacterium]MCM1393608.1 hypothetical protein [[Eubacterium] siraeum]MCM1456092.1 hypothetical protein [Bacteroides sp.]